MCACVYYRKDDFPVDSPAECSGGDPSPSCLQRTTIWDGEDTSSQHPINLLEDIRVSSNEEEGHGWMNK